MQRMFTPTLLVLLSLPLAAQTVQSYVTTADLKHTLEAGTPRTFEQGQAREPS